MLVRLTLYVVYHLLRMVYIIVQRMWWKMNGTEHQLLICSRHDGHQRCVQVMRILARHKLSIVDESPSLANFVACHQEFVQPEYVLQDRVTLHCIQRDVAVFVETPSNVRVDKLEFGAFLRVSQYEYATHLVLVPMHAFLRLSVALGPPRCNVIIVSNTSRCGSTLLCQLFEQNPECMALSEPDAPNTLNKLQHVMAEDEALQLAAGIMNVQCKPLSSNSTKAIIVKLSALSPDVIPILSKACPYARHIFMYRDGVKVAQSLARAIEGGCTLANVAFLLGRVHVSITRALIEHMGYDTTQCNINSKDPFAWTFYLWAYTVRKYLDWRKNGMDIAAVRYEDLQNCPAQVIRNLLEHLDLPREWKIPCLQGLSVDSQRHSEISRQALNKIPMPKPSAAVNKLLIDMCSQMDLPSPYRPCILEGTISC